MSDRMEIEIGVVSTGADSALDNLNKKIDSLEQKLTQSSNSGNKLKNSVSGVNGALSTMSAIAGGDILARSFYKALDAAQALLKVGIDYNKTLETTQLGIAAIITSMDKITTSNGRVLEGAEKFNAALKISSGVQAQLQTIAMTTVATYQELLMTYQGILAPAQAAGFTMKQTADMAGLMTNSVKAIGLPMNQIVQESRDLLSGQIDQNSQLAKSLDITRKDVEEWKNKGILYDKINEKLVGFKLASEEFSKTWEGAWSNFKDISSKALGDGMKPLFEAIKVEMNALTNDFVTITKDASGKILDVQVKPEVIARLREISEALITIGHALETTAKLSIKFGDDLAVAFAAWRIQGFVTGLGAAATAATATTTAVSGLTLATEALVTATKGFLPVLAAMAVYEGGKFAYGKISTMANAKFEQFRQQKALETPEGIVDGALAGLPAEMTNPATVVTPPKPRPKEQKKSAEQRKQESLDQQWVGTDIDLKAKINEATGAWDKYDKAVIEVNKHYDELASKFKQTKDAEKRAQRLGEIEEARKEQLARLDRDELEDMEAKWDKEIEEEKRAQDKMRQQVEATVQFKKTAEAEFSKWREQGNRDEVAAYKASQERELEAYINRINKMKSTEDNPNGLSESEAAGMITQAQSANAVQTARGVTDINRRISDRNTDFNNGTASLQAGLADRNGFAQDNFNSDMAGTQQKYDQDKELLNRNLEDKLITQQQYNDRLAAMTASTEQKISDMKVKHKQNEIQMVGSQFGNLASIADSFYQLSGKKSKAAFAVMKAMQIGQTVANTASAAMGAYNAMASIPYVGPALGVAAAAAAVMAGAIQVKNIMSATPEGGGTIANGAASSANASASMANAANATPPAYQQVANQAQIQIVVQGNIIDESKSWVATQLAPVIQDLTNRGYQFS